MKTKILIITLLIVVLVGGFAFRTQRQVIQGRAALATLFARRNHLQQQVAQMEVRLRAARAAVASANEKTGAISAPTASGSATGIAVAAGKQGSESAGRRMSALSLIATDPRKLAEYTKSFRAGLALDYGPHFRALGLSPDLIEKLKDVEVALELMKMDLRGALDIHGLEPDSPEYKKLEEDYHAARASKKAEVLGDLASRYFDFHRSNNVRGYARGLPAASFVTGEPITADQIDRTGDILAANCKRTSADSYPGWTQPATIDWSAASGQLKTILSPTQIEFVRLQFESDKLKARVDERTKLLTAQFKKQAGAK